MRIAIAAAMAGLLAACGAAAPPPPVAEGYGIEVFATEDGGVVYLVRLPDGRAAAAQGVEGGESGLMPAETAADLVAQRMGLFGADNPEQLSMRLPGLALSIADGEGAPGEPTRIAVNIGGREMLIDVRGEGTEAGEQAAIRIRGASEDDVRDTIDTAVELSADTRAALYEAIGLSPN